MSLEEKNDDNYTKLIQIINQHNSTNKLRFLSLHNIFVECTITDQKLFYDLVWEIISNTISEISRDFCNTISYNLTSTNRIRRFKRLLNNLDINWTNVSNFVRVYKIMMVDNIESTLCSDVYKEESMILCKWWMKHNFHTSEVYYLLAHFKKYEMIQLMIADLHKNYGAVISGIFSRSSRLFNSNDMQLLSKSMDVLVLQFVSKKIYENLLSKHISIRNCKLVLALLHSKKNILQKLILPGNYHLCSVIMVKKYGIPMDKSEWSMIEIIEHTIRIHSVKMNDTKCNIAFSITEKIIAGFTSKNLMKLSIYFV